ncbi:MAG TPA: response regulator transcription factor [Candidatus Acidoferrales bacterium]|nr:response regulator transcription factor [Candidatus Acidoferrales bacterium]
MDSILNKNILIIDDDERMLRALDRVLGSEGAVITTTKWAGDAIEFLIRREKIVDLVITDLRMPLVTGMTLVYAIHLIFPAIPTIVLTAFGNPEIRDECLRQGAAAFLEKTLSTSQLLAAIEKVLALQESDPRTSRRVMNNEKMTSYENIKPDKTN